jgi:peptidoglycan/LPS O-acetylase OafA/YrhL
MTSNAPKLEALNGIRGFAVLLVLLSHSSASGMVLHEQLDFTGAGRYGVFLFFVLSAFLLTRQFLIADPSGRFSRPSLIHYCSRRFLRIYPLYTLALLVNGLLFWKGYIIVPITKEMFFRSLLLLDAEGLFWTVPVEFQYYFLLPLVACMLALCSNIFVVLLIGTLFCTVWTYLVPPEYTVNVLPFIPVFLIGSIGAKLFCWMQERGLQPRERKQKVVNIGAILALFAYLLITPHFYNLIFSANIGRVHFHEQFIGMGFMGLLLILLTLNSTGFARSLMESRFFVFWGKVSFSAYLGHKIVLVFIDQVGFLPPLWKFILFFIFTGLFSYLSYRFFERPLATIRLAKAKVA